MKLIVAVSKNGVIGKDGSLPWKCPEDMRHFRETTIDNCVVMGYNTFKSLGKRPLPRRSNIIVNEREAPQFQYLDKEEKHYFAQVQSYTDIVIEDAYYQKYEESWGIIYLIGGARTYQRFLNLNVINELIVTHINEEYEGDTFFEIPAEWQVTGEKVLSDRATVKYYGRCT